MDLILGNLISLNDQIFNTVFNIFKFELFKYDTMTIPGRRLLAYSDNIAMREYSAGMSSSINTYDLTMINKDSSIERTNTDFANPLVKIRRIYEKKCAICIYKNYDTLKYLYMGANLVTYVHSNLNDDGMSAISFFNNDFGYKIFSY